MSTELGLNGYEFDSNNKIWTRPGYGGIAYNDGDEVEQRLQHILQHAEDLSVLSDELQGHCTDWPSLYHLSGSRANILRPLSKYLSGDILEIGAGCGAITRYLGECGSTVLALEGSPRRAAIARERSRDLDNVTVVSDRFDSFNLDKKFDVVTLIGVLEYSNLFSQGDDPALIMLERARSLLKPGGVLLVAIENQFGLKYFSGAPEDHLGVPMYGIENRYKSNQPQTFGRKVLLDMFQRSGYRDTQFLYPFPDYKFPASILPSHAFTKEKFDAAALVWQSVRKDPQFPPVVHFSSELVWPSIIQNDMAPDLANSFLIVARNTEPIDIDSSTLAWHYSTNRRRAFCKEAVFSSQASGKIEVQYRYLAPSPPAEQSSHGPLEFSRPSSSCYELGPCLLERLIKIVSEPNWTMEDVEAFFSRYLGYISAICAAEGRQIDTSGAESELPGFVFDIIPQNIICQADDDWIAIDREWTMKEGLTVGYLLFRVIGSLLGAMSRIARPHEASIITAEDLLRSLFSRLGFTFSLNTVEKYMNLEATIQRHVSNRKFDVKLELESWTLKQLSPALKWIDEKHEVALIGKIARLEAGISQRDVQASQMQNYIAEYEKNLAVVKAENLRLTEDRGRLHEDLNAATRQLQEIQASKSWKITAPLRYLNRFFN